MDVMKFKYQLPPYPVAYVWLVEITDIHGEFERYEACGSLVIFFIIIGIFAMAGSGRFQCLIHNVANRFMLLLRMMSDYNVETINDGLNEFNVEFNGPKDSLYEGGFWKIRVELPDAYPYKSPSIGFVNKIFHPNVDELSGAVCLDVINQSWSPMFDPLNGDAASLMMKDRKLYDQKVKEYCERYAKKEHVTNLTPEEESDDEEHPSDEESDQSDDEDEGDIAGHADL
ncbi:hypothetical protein TIFTF001_015027 [Ficus carica]|uniref:UBC core domain-containing protein n=1 Tax=Ficus carica TaxID=3494 RepID=A0AA87ZXX8_FICCA|nr:hypothetical protein TIFTF001_015027 [Ficus carica]